MAGYLHLAHQMQKRTQESLEETLVSISTVLMALVQELSSEEIEVFKRNIPTELRQILNRGKLAGGAKGRHDAKQLVETIASRLEIPAAEAKIRCLALLQELSTGLTPWDELAFVELLERVSSDLARVEIPAAVA